MHPALLSAQGLAAAVEALAERSPVPMAIRRLPHDRLAPAVEAAAYFAIAEAVRNAPGGVGVDLHRDDDWLVGIVQGLSAADVDIERAGWLVEVADRVGALGGRVDVERDQDASVLRVEVPCG